MKMANFAANFESYRRKKTANGGGKSSLGTPSDGGKDGKSNDLYPKEQSNEGPPCTPRGQGACHEMQTKLIQRVKIVAE